MMKCLMCGDEIEDVICDLRGKKMDQKEIKELIKARKEQIREFKKSIRISQRDIDHLEKKLDQ